MISKQIGADGKVVEKADSVPASPPSPNEDKSSGLVTQKSLLDITSSSHSDKDDKVSLLATTPYFLVTSNSNIIDEYNIAFIYRTTVSP